MQESNQKPFNIKSHQWKKKKHTHTLIQIPVLKNLLNNMHRIKL